MCPRRVTTLQPALTDAMPSHRTNVPSPGGSSWGPQGHSTECQIMQPPCLHVTACFRTPDLPASASTERLSTDRVHLGVPRRGHRLNCAVTEHGSKVLDMPGEAEPGSLPGNEGTDSDRRVAVEDMATCPPRQGQRSGSLWDTQLWNPELCPTHITLARPHVETMYGEVPQGDGPPLSQRRCQRAGERSPGGVLTALDCER